VPSSSAGPDPVDLTGSGRRIEVYVALAAPDGGLHTLPAPDHDPDRSCDRLPGAVLGHGEAPLSAAARALNGSGRAGPPLLLREVRSRVEPARGPAGGPGMHVIQLVFQADRSRPLPIDPQLLRSPAPAGPVAASGPAGGPPLVQRPGAYVFVERDGEVLLSRVAGGGPWMLPGGGIDHGEHPDDAVRRETFEETGLRLDDARLVGAGSRHFTGLSPLRVLENFHAVRILYTGRITDRSRPQVQEVDGSTDAAAWVPRAELARIPLADLVRDALERWG